MVYVARKKNITLVDSVGKKTAFLKQTCAELKLSNITVINKRVEDVTTNKLFDSIIARAFSDMQMLHRSNKAFNRK